MQNARKGLNAKFFAWALIAYASPLKAHGDHRDHDPKVLPLSAEVKTEGVSENVLENVKTLTEPKSNFSQAHLISGALIGFLAGAGSAALLTPKTGEQLRKVLSTRSQDLADLINKNGHMKKRIAKAKRAVKKKVKRAIKA